MEFVHVCVADLQGVTLVSEDFESERGVESPSRRLVFADRQRDLLQTRLELSAANQFRKQLLCDAAAAMLMGNVDAPDPGLVRVFETRTGVKADGSDQPSFEKGAQNEGGGLSGR